MKKLYNFDKRFAFIPLLIPLVFAGVFYYQQNFIYHNPAIPNDFFISIIVKIIVLFSVIALLQVSFYLTRIIKVENGLVSKYSLGFKIWSVKISDITDITTGNVSSFSRGHGIRISGGVILFNKNNDKIYQTGRILQDPQSLIHDLEKINQNIKYQENAFLVKSPLFLKLETQKFKKISWIVVITAIVWIISMLLR